MTTTPSNNPDRRIELVDTTLRDGMSSVSHQFTAEQVAQLARGLDEAGVRTIEVAHGIGLGASSIQYGFAAETDVDYVRAAVDAVEQADIAALYVPGIATLPELDAAIDAGIRTVRVAVHCTEADCGQQPIEYAKDKGLRVMSFLMMSHKLDPEPLAEQGAKLASYGADVVYVVDSAGAMVPDQAAARVLALRAAMPGQAIGFHAHNNLGVAIGNSLAAAESAFERAGWDTGTTLWPLIDTAEQVLAPIMTEPQIVDETALVLGYAGVYSTFFHPTKRAAKKYGLSSRAILLELGRRGIIGGQEDMIIDVAAEMARARDASSPVAAAV